MGNASDVTVNKPQPYAKKKKKKRHIRLGLSGWPLLHIHLFYDVVMILMGLVSLGFGGREVVVLKRVMCFGILPLP